MLTGRQNASRGSRASASHTRGTMRGGVRKNRSSATRIDRDGDLMMDAETGNRMIDGNESKRGSGRSQIDHIVSTRSMGLKGGSNRGPKSGLRRAQQSILRGIRAQQSNSLASLEVTGLSLSKASAHDDGGLESLLGFLERKASGLDSKSNRSIRIRKSSHEGDSVLITASEEDIAQIQKLDNTLFAGATLSIKPYQSPIGKSRENKEISAEAKSLKDGLREFLATRYNPELKLLDLSMLGTDPRLQGMGVFKEGIKTAGKLFAAIMAICDGLFKSPKDKQDAIVSIALTDNSLSTITPISSLSQTFPDIKNLDLSRNKIPDLKALDPWRWKFRSLEILLLKDNPIESQISVLKHELMKRYPRLHTINDLQVRTPEQITAIISAAEYAKTPIPIAGPVFRDLDQVGETFIRHFLPLYDNDRVALAASAYDAESTFSLSVNMLSPRSTEVTLPVYTWSDYVRYSRNLDKVTYLSARMHRQFIGTENIQAIWNILPATEHPDIESENDKFLFEGHELPCVPDPTCQSPTGVTGMIINIHGEFKEPGNFVAGCISLRSFSRTFILGPGPPGGPAIRVISDMLIIRPWAPLAQPTTTFIANQSNQSNPEKLVLDQSRQSDIPSVGQQQEIMTRQFMQHTGMTLQYCVLCLQQADWDMQKADELFKQTKATLPTDAFITAGG